MLPESLVRCFGIPHRMDVQQGIPVVSSSTRWTHRNCYAADGIRSAQELHELHSTCHGLGWGILDRHMVSLVFSASYLLQKQSPKNHLLGLHFLLVDGLVRPFHQIARIRDIVIVICKNLFCHGSNLNGNVFDDSVDEIFDNGFPDDLGEVFSHSFRVG